jgi:uncharacterized protein (DUF2126 family)
MDFDDVMAELQRAGFAFDGLVRAALRVPLPAGRRAGHDGHRLTPAHRARALARDGRRGRAGGTVRYVDSSLERLEVKVTG